MRMSMIGRLIAYGLFASAMLAPAAATSPRRTAPGFSYRHDQIPAGPWSAHIVTIDRSNPNLELHTTLPPGARFGLANLSAQVKGLGVSNGHVLAAINGDYY